jgi:16S rRNA (cytosine967-C5)-methyltransferase
MRPTFCDYHICAFLESYSQTQKPLDLSLSNYLKAHKSIGANDRRTISEILYGMVRWKTLLEHLCPSNHPLDRLSFFKKLSLEKAKEDPSIPEPIRLGVTDFLYQALSKAYGTEKTRELCRTLNTQAPITVRANLLKTTREDLLKLWENKFDVAPCKKSKVGIQFRKREPLFTLPEFKAGLFEVQDEGSQLVAELVKVKPKDHVLDYCSGSGGKTLGFAPAMQGKGQIYLHDNRPWILTEARKRLNRAGIQNVQFVLPKKKMDWVLVDAPCSGTGTLRRNPDAKWKIDAPMIDRLIEQQREIMREALTFAKPDGHIVYATCSLLPQENEDQVAYFLKHHPLTLVEEPLLLFPEEGGMDGFFAAVFKKQTMI